jgi:hypothetical protein
VTYWSTIRSNGTDYIPPSDGEEYNNPIDRGGLSFDYSINTCPCTITVPGTMAYYAAKKSWDIYHHTAPMLPHFPWDDDPGPMVRTTEHHRSHTHQSARLLRKLPWDDDPCPSPLIYPPGSPWVTRCSRTPDTAYLTASGGEEDILSIGEDYRRCIPSLSVHVRSRHLMKQKTTLPNAPGIRIIRQHER